MGVGFDQPGDGVGLFLPAGNRCVARAFGAARELRHVAHGQLEAGFFVGFAALDLFLGQLPVLGRVLTHDAARDVTVGDAFDLELVQVTEIGDLLERKGGVVDQPNGGRFGHQWGLLGHATLLCTVGISGIGP